MFLHRHPYDPFIPEHATTLIVGTLPPPRFSMGQLKPWDVRFCYGSQDGQLWPILDRIFELNLIYDHSEQAVAQRKTFLKAHRIGICDVVAHASRKKLDASDLGMQEVALRPMLEILNEHNTVKRLLFTGGNSKNGPEYFFRKLLRNEGKAMHVISDSVPRIHFFEMTNRRIETVSLTAPSGSANRAVGSMPDYKMKRQKDPNYTTLDYRVDQYRPFFEAARGL